MSIIDLTMLEPECFYGVYKEFANLLGSEIAVEIHTHFQGQTISIPKKILSDDYIQQLILTEFDGNNIKAIAATLGYTQNWTARLIRKYRSEVKVEYSLDEKCVRERGDANTNST